MKNIKDVWYNINDIILVIIIVAVSAAVITWRVNNIFAYTGKMARGTSVQKSKNVSEFTVDDKKPEKINPWLEAGTLREDMEITIVGHTSVDMVKKLEEEKLFSSYADFQAACAQAGTNPDNIKEGTYIFKEGTSKEAFIKAIAPAEEQGEEETSEQETSEQE